MEWFGLGQGRYGLTMTHLLNGGEILPIFLDIDSFRAKTCSAH